jgi:hypothetical protein
MSSLYLILPVILIIFLSFLIVRAAAVLLIITGMDPQRAKFQALSAFTRTGFTTREAEMVVRNPARRRIIIWLMILGNAGIITVMVTATSAFVQSRGIFVPVNIAFLAVGIAAVWLIARYSGLGEKWERFIVRRFGRAPTTEELFCEDLTHLAEGYGILRVQITAVSPFEGQPLSGIRAKGHVLVLGIERGESWIALPEPEDVVHGGDALIVFGRMGELRPLFQGQRRG